MDYIDKIWMILNIYIEYLLLNIYNIHIHIVYIIFIRSCLSIIPSLNYITHTRNPNMCYYPLLTAYHGFWVWGRRGGVTIYIYIYIYMLTLGVY